MPYSRLVVTPIMEQSDFNDPDNQVFKVNLHFKLWDKTHLADNITYIKSKKLNGELFTYGYLNEFIEQLSSGDIEEIQNEVRVEIGKELEAKSLIPLREFYCDKCGVIVNYEDAIIQYHFDTRLENFSMYKRPTGFQIVHPETCTHTEEEIKEYGDCIYFGLNSNSDGLAQTIAIIEENDDVYPEELIELIKRTQLPYYEEARLRKDKIERVARSLDWPQQQKYLRENLRQAVITTDEEFKEQERRSQAAYEGLKKQGLIADPLEFLSSYMGTQKDEE